MKPKHDECLDCGLTRSSCEMKGGDEWVQNCQKVVGKKHRFTPHSSNGTWEEEFDELLTHYKRGYEGDNTAVNKLRKEPNSVLEQELKEFIRNVLASEHTSMIGEIEKMKKPVSKVTSIMMKKGIDSKGLKKEINPMRIHNEALDQVINYLKNNG